MTLGISSNINFREGKKRTLVSAGLFGLLAALKLVLGAAFSSPIIFADGIHSLIDVLMTMVAFVGILLLERPPSTTFQYGLYKGENLTTLMMAIFIGGASYEVIMSSLERFHTIYPDILISVEIFSIIVSLALMWWVRKTPGIKLGIITAESTHDYQDALVAVVVIAGIMFEWINNRDLSIAMTMVITAYLLYQAVKIGKDAIMSLMDASDREMVKRIREIVISVPGAVGVHDIRTRKAGPFYFAEMHLEAPHLYSVDAADKLADEVEVALKGQIPVLSSVSIHVEPGNYSGYWIIAIPEDVNGNIAPHLGKTTSVKIYNTRNKSYEIIKNIKYSDEGGRIAPLLKLFKDKGVQVLLVREVGDVGLYALRGIGIDIYSSDTENEEDAVSAFINGKLRKVEG